MKWWKSLKKWATETAVEVELKALNKDVSEPVISFLRTFNANPKRFKVIPLTDFKSNYHKYLTTGRHVSPTMDKFKFVDKVTKDGWTFSSHVPIELIVDLCWGTSTQRTDPYPRGLTIIHDSGFLTEDEKEIIISTVYNWHCSRVLNKISYSHRHRVRREKIQAIEAKKKAEIERERLKGVYCN
ncbi:hypothetical protein [Pseudomonas phage vB_PseuGesM_254]|uniref:Uncharacterized protein n=1 Tax=Pseudomonas phage vB_PseuGesM_254 TaxID=3092638 RepID=A0AAX4G698_9CAUD|nr:hypothetical protein [Pseudomonas phage PseuGes_254]